MMGRLAYILVGAAFIAGLGMVGRADMNDEIAEAVFYCDMVADGHWPNYNPETDCGKVYAAADLYLTEGN
tara:strand:- start:485 stop:694 length:210 start_codon:yes stop_codon:yes gene_type:complete